MQESKYGDNNTTQLQTMGREDGREIRRAAQCECRPSCGRESEGEGGLRFPEYDTQFRPSSTAEMYAQPIRASIALKAPHMHPHIHMNVYEFRQSTLELTLLQLSFISHQNLKSGYSLIPRPHQAFT